MKVYFKFEQYALLLWNQIRKKKCNER